MVQRNIFRKMTLEDVPVVHAIEQTVMQGPWSEKLFADCIRVGYECWVVVEETKFIGYAILSYAANEAHILNFVIAPEFQRQGYGQLLLNHIIQSAKVQDAEELFLEVRVSNEAAINLYKKNNFIEIGMRRGYYPSDNLGNPAEDAITMTLSLW